jgi:cell division septal protein FtsQ
VQNDSYLLLRPPEIRNAGGLVSNDEILRYFGWTAADLEKKRVNIFSLDLPALRDVFLKSYPTVSEFAIQRRLPDSLVITVGEHSPVARVGMRHLVVDDEGRVFAVSARAEILAESLPLLASERFADCKAGGLLPDADMVALAILRAERLSRTELHYHIAEIDLTGDLYVEVTTTENIRLKLPRDQLGDAASIAHCLHLASKTVATSRIGPGRTLIVGRDNRVTLQ